MATAPTTIPASGAVPDYNDRSTFGARVLAWDVWTRDQMVPGVNAAALNAYTNALDAYTQALASAASATAASNSASAAGAPLWVSGTTYAIGNLVRSPANGRVYQRRTSGAGTTDPASDVTNYSLYSFALSLLEASGAQTLAVGNHYVLTSNATYTLPASPIQGDRIKLTPVSSLTGIFIDFNGVKVRGVTQSSTMQLDMQIEIQYDNSTYGWN
jgi:hypothetical protein